MLRGIEAKRRVIRLGGAEAREFLQDLVTNDVSGATGDRAVYAALLTPQGKYLADFFVLEDAAGEGMLVDAAAEQAQGLAQRLALYRLRRKIPIEDAGLSVAVVWGEAPAAWPQGVRAVEDPRAGGLGWRLYGAAPLAAVGAEAAEPAEWDARRVAFGVPESGVELTPETYVLEAGFERLNGVDFRKGCFVGQEIVARMKHKSELRKGLVRVRVEGEAEPGTAVETAEGKAAGTLFTVAGGEGLAHLRFDRARGALKAGEARVTLAE
ncbi:MAG: folate-binding protein [Paracoccaceae bacterium]